MDEDMSEEAWESEFFPFENPTSGTWFFDPDEPIDAAFMAKLGENHIWTEVDIDFDTDSDLQSAVIPGTHWVNRIGYIVTMVPWSAEHADLEIHISWPPPLKVVDC